MIDTQSLVGKFLIATPYMPDPLFARSVILICGEDNRGIVGFIINRPIETLSLKDFFSQLKISLKQSYPLSSRIYFGGPVDTTRGFVLHTSDYKNHGSLPVKVEDQEFYITNQLDILASIAQGKGPSQFLLMLGYVGWDRYHLMQELEDNFWLITEGRKEMVFQENPAFQWEKIYAMLGIDPKQLSLSPGHA